MTNNLIPTLVAIILTFAGALEARANPSLKKKGTSLPVKSEEAGLLRQAYFLMARADHDYQGHRAQAMHDTADAAHLVGENLSGDGRGGELQGQSDVQLRAALGILRRVEAGAVAERQAGLRKHVQGAIRQLSIALSIR